MEYPSLNFVRPALVNLVREMERFEHDLFRLGIGSAGNRARISGSIPFTGGKIPCMTFLTLLERVAIVFVQACCIGIEHCKIAKEN